ncbi:hypothetical protein AXF11_07555 [Leptotrichia sp. oral taxon 847]|nr:hypothetical protein AXF11_07555 [Leptotrichia sp. oral taxon 847]
MKISKIKILTVLIFYLRIFILVKLLFFTSLDTSKEYEIWTYMKFIDFEYLLLIFWDKKNKVLNLIINLFFSFGF